jgi:hypothetical protein
MTAPTADFMKAIVDYVRASLQNELPTANDKTPGLVLDKFNDTLETWEMFVCA